MFEASLSTFVPFLVQPPPRPPKGERNPQVFVDKHIAEQERLAAGTPPNAVNGQWSTVISPPAYEPHGQRGPEVCQCNAVDVLRCKGGRRVSTG